MPFLAAPLAQRIHVEIVEVRWAMTHRCFSSLQGTGLVRVVCFTVVGDDGWIGACATQQVGTLSSKQIEDFGHDIASFIERADVIGLRRIEVPMWLPPKTIEAEEFSIVLRGSNAKGAAAVAAHFANFNEQREAAPVFVPVSCHFHKVAACEAKGRLTGAMLGATPEIGGLGAHRRCRFSP